MWVSDMDINKCTPCRAGAHPQFSSSENRCTHIAKNPSHKCVRQFRVDGEVFPAGNAPKRCDYLLLNDTDQRSYYIELKGSDVLRAIEQIESSISLIGPSIKEYEIFCRIIFRTSTHEVTGADAIRWKKRRKAVIKSVQYTETL